MPLCLTREVSLCAVAAAGSRRSIASYPVPSATKKTKNSIKAILARCFVPKMVKNGYKSDIAY
jgi:hypothetical protein